MGAYDEGADAVRKRVTAASPRAVAVGTPVVIDCGGCAGIVGIPESGGTLSYQPCAEDGTVVTDSSSANFTSGTVVSPVPWRWVKVTATTADGMVCTV